MAWVNAIIQGVLTGGLYAWFACGLSLMFGVMKVVNLAHGDLAVVAGYVAIGIITVTHAPVLWSFLIVVPVMAVAGYALQRTLLQGALDRGVLTTLIVTFGLSVVIENGLLQFFTANSRGIGAGLPLVRGSFTIGSQIQIGYLLVLIFAVAVVVLLGLQYFLSASKYGRMIRAVADDQEAAQLAGVNYKHVFGIAAAVAFGTVALAGIAYGMYSQLDPTTGTDTILLFAFAAVVIGGLGSLWGTLLGGIVLGVAQEIRAQINIWYEQIVVVVVLFLFPYYIGPGTTGIMVQALIVLTLASMWNLLAGYAGLVSLGQQAFFGLGAYFVLIPAMHGVTPWLGLPIAAIGAAVCAVPLWWLVSRLRTGYFAIGTWVLAAAIMLVIEQIQSIGGGTGEP